MAAWGRGVNGRRLPADRRLQAERSPPRDELSQVVGDRRVALVERLGQQLGVSVGRAGAGSEQHRRHLGHDPQLKAGPVQQAALRDQARHRSSSRRPRRCCSRPSWRRTPAARSSSGRRRAARCARSATGDERDVGTARWEQGGGSGGGCVAGWVGHQGLEWGFDASRQDDDGAARFGRDAARDAAEQDGAQRSVSA